MQLVTAQTTADLVSLLIEIAKIGQVAPAMEIAFCPPCSELISLGMEIGAENIAKRLLDPDQPSEFALSPGLALYRSFYYSAERGAEDECRVYLMIGGWAAQDYYPETATKIRYLIRERGFENPS